MMQVKRAINLSLMCPFGKRVDATLNSPSIHDLFINLSTALVTNPGDNRHLTLEKNAAVMVALNDDKNASKDFTSRAGS